MPLVVLHRETRFVAVTEAVHSLVVDAQLAQLRASQEVHETFTELSVEGADAAEVVRQAARMAGAPVVLENLSHQVLAYDAAGARPESVLDGWEARSRVGARPSGARRTTSTRAGWSPRSAPAARTGAGSCSSPTGPRTAIRCCSSAPPRRWP